MAEREGRRPDLGAALAAACPVPASRASETILMAHGGGGRLTQRADRDASSSRASTTRRSRELHDGAVLEAGGRRGSRSRPTPSSSSPLFFPGGDIGSLAVHGTVNDLAMCGAQPLALSAGLILEEGLPMDDLWRIVALDAARPPRGAGVLDRHGRHEGRRPRQGRRRLHQHRRASASCPPGVAISPRRARPGRRRPR